MQIFWFTLAIAIQSLSVYNSGEKLCPEAGTLAILQQKLLKSSSNEQKISIE